MNKQELAEQILKSLAKRNGFSNWNEILNDYNKGFTSEETFKALILAAIVEAMNTPAKEDVVNIERKDLEKNIRAFINRTCFSTTIQGRYGNWMSLRECLTSFGFELLSSIEKKLAAPAKEGITHVMIECPECETIQAAIIEHTVPFGTYIHHCENCKYIIMESEWNQVKPFKAPAKEVEAISDSELEQLANDAIPTHPYPDMEYPATAVTKFKRESWMDGYKAAKEAISVPAQEEDSDRELEITTDKNMDLISDFIEHLKDEAGIEIPESAVLSFFNA